MVSVERIVDSATRLAAVALVLASPAGCWKQPSTGGPNGSAANERVIASAPAIYNPPVPNVRFRVVADEATVVGAPVRIGIEIIDGRTTPVELTVTGNGRTRTERTEVRFDEEPFQGCDPVHSASECDRGQRREASWVELRRLEVGEYTVRARILDGLAKYEPTIKLRVVPEELARAYVVHQTGNFGDFVKLSRSAVETSFGGTRVRVSRAVYEHAGDHVTVDVTDDLSTTPGVADAIARAAPVAGELVWLAQPDMMAGLVAVRIRGTLAPSIVEHYRSRFRAPPQQQHTPQPQPQLRP